MKNTWLRLFIAAFVSLTSLAIVQIWFDLTTPDSFGVNNQEPIAFIKSVKDDVDKRPIKRQVWQSLTKGDYVFSGEAIRTAKDSEVQIEFVDGGHSINIEPDSIVLIAQNSNKELALDLMEGGATVTAITPQASESVVVAPAINLIQNGKTVLIKGNATLTKANNGSLEIQSNEMTQNINPFFTMMNDGRIMPFKLLSPLKEKYIFADGDNGIVKISWANVPKDLMTKVALGSQRSVLNLIREVQPGQSALVDYNLSAGFYFYKIFFINPQNNKIVAESKLQKIKVLERNMPVVVNPTINQIFSMTEPKQKILFNWTDGEYVKNYYFELFKDANLKSRIVNKNFDKQQSFEVDLPEGEYFYKLSAKFETENKMIPGKVEKFALQKKPEPTEIMAKPLPPPPPPVVPVGPTKIEQINWVQTNYLDDRGAEEQKYVGQPELEMKWEIPRGAKVSEYRVKLTPQNQTGGKAIELKTSQSSVKTKLLKPGRYIASIEGVDQMQKLVGSSHPKFFIVSELPMLTSPEFIGGSKMTADKKGDFQVKWLYLDGAIKFRINLIDSTGKQVHQTIMTRTGGELSAKFEDMPPGEYKVEVAGMDKAGRFGTIAKKSVTVLDAADLNAPKLKKLKVK